MDDGKIVLGYNDATADISSAVFIPNPGGNGSRALVSSVRNSSGKLNFANATSAEVTGTINSISANNANTNGLEGHVLKDNTIAESKLAAAVITKLNAEVNLDGVLGFTSDMKWEIEIQSHVGSGTATAPTSPATIGFGYKTFTPNGVESDRYHIIDFIFPTATTKEDIDALVLGRTFAIELPEGVFIFKPATYVKTVNADWRAIMEKGIDAKFYQVIRIQSQESQQATYKLHFIEVMKFLSLKAEAEL